MPANHSVFIPYGAYWSSPFARWQGDLAHLHAMRFAAHVTRAELAARNIDPTDFDFGVYGLTVPQKSCFYGLPWVAGMIGAETLAGPTINQACATGVRMLATAAGEIQLGCATNVLAISGDRTSNGAHIVYPAPQSAGGTAESEDWVMDNFSKDPWAECAMVETAENVASREGISTQEQHELVLRRCEQYCMATANDNAFHKRYMTLPFAVPDAKFRKTVSTMSGDSGVKLSSKDGLSQLRPVLEGGSVTFGGQTFPADGVAGMVLASSPELARRASQDETIKIEILAFGQSREDKAFMPAAPIKAAASALQHANLHISDMAVIKSHNPFAVNDIAFARAFDIDWSMMNNYGCSLIFGHPQGPTGLRCIIEMIEELAMTGGGYGLFQGCAAGDSAMAIIIKVYE